MLPVKVVMLEMKITFFFAVAPSPAFFNSIEPMFCQVSAHLEPRRKVYSYHFIPYLIWETRRDSGAEDEDTIPGPS